jgi:nicotinamidase/pyrazinamidase
MDIQKTIFWNVDTQKDFIEPDGKLYVQGAEEIKQKLRQITKLAKEYNIRVVNTADYHFVNSRELDKNPDMMNTFPEHCMAGSEGAEYIKETDPESPIIFDWDKDYFISNDLLDINHHRNIVLRKDAFDVFRGTPHAKKILEIISPDVVFVYGVTTNICVNFAVVELAKKVKQVYVIADAIKELPGIPLPFKKWEKLKVRLISYEELEKLIMIKVF